MEIKIKDGTRVICGLLVAVSLFFYYITCSFPKEKGLMASPYGSAFFPRFVLIFLIVAAIALFLQVTFRKQNHSAEPTLQVNKTHLARSFAVWGISMLFFWLWQYLGYLYVSPLYILAVALLLGSPNWKRLVPLMAVAPVMYLVFEHFLKVGL